MGRVILRIVADGPPPPRDPLADTAPFERQAREGAPRDRRILSERRRRRHDLEARPWRVEAVARAIEQGLVARPQRGDLGERRPRRGHFGPRAAHGRQDLAPGAQHDRGAAAAASLGDRASQVRGRAQLQADVDRYLHVARARQEGPHDRVVRPPPVAQQRHQLAQVAPQHPVGPVAARRLHLDHPRAIVIAAQPRIRVPLDERRVARGPVHLAPRVAEQVVGDPHERVAPAALGRARRRGAEAQARERLGVLLQVLRAARGQGDAVAVEDRAPGDRLCDRQQAGVVGEAPRSVALHREDGRGHRGVRAPRLQVGRAQRDDRQQRGEHRDESARGSHELGRGRGGGPPRADCEQDPDRRQVRDHRRAAVAEERRGHAGQRQHAEQAAGDEQERQHDPEAQAERQEEAVVAIRAHRDPDATATR